MTFKHPSNSFIRIRTFWIFAFLLIGISEAFGNSGITYHGKIIKPDGVTPVTSNQTVFRIQVRTPGAENCLLWEEQQTKDLSSSNGVFTVTIADTSEVSLVANALPFSLERVFSNRSNFTGLTGCTAGTTYNPSTVDGRSLVVYFKENPSDLVWEQMPITKVNYVPLALNSVQLEGYKANEFLKIDPLSSYTTLTAANVNTLVDIIAGTNNQYLRPATTFGGDVTGTYNATVVERIRGRNVVATAPTAGQVLKFDGTNWAPAADDAGSTVSDATYAAKGIVQIDTNLATSGLSLTTGVLSMPAVGTAGTYGSSILIPIITTDAKGRITTVTTAAPDDVTKLPLLGGTMQGSIDMGGFNITNATSLASTNVSTRNVILSDNDTNTITIRSPTDIAANYVLDLPVDNGNSGQVLSTDGNGVLSWVAANSALSLTGDRAVITNGTGTALTNFTCSVGQVMGFNGSGVPVCTDVTGAGGFVQNGNSYGANAVLGTNDNFDLGFETNGTTKMTILANGHVGIGTASPGTVLEINSGTASGTMNIRNSSSTASSMIQATNSGGLSVSLISHGSVAAGTTAGISNARMGVLNSQTVDGLLINSTAGIRIASSSVERIHINPTGNVGIGTTSPNTILDVNGAISQRGMAAPAVSPAGEGRIYFDSTSNKFQVSQNGGAYADLVSAGGGGDIANGGNTFGAAATIGTNDSFGLNFETSGSTRMSISDTGSVAIGNVAPQAGTSLTLQGALYLNGNASGGLGHSPTSAGIGYGTGSIILESLFSSDNSMSQTLYKVRNANSNDQYAYIRGVSSTGAGVYSPSLVFGTQSNATTYQERMRIASNGFLGIGTTAPSTALTINGATTQLGMAAPGLSAAGEGRIYFDSTSNKFQVSQNGGAYTDLVSSGGGTASGTAGHLQYSNGSGGFSSDSNQLFWDATNNRLAVGNTSPENTLHVSGRAKVGTLTGYDSGADLMMANMGGSYIHIGSDANDFLMGSNATDSAFRVTFGDLQFRTGGAWNANAIADGTTRMILKNSGNVGIGTTSPNTVLDINGAVSQRGMAAPAVSPAGQGRIYFDSTSNKFRVSQNGGAYTDLVSAGGGGSGDILNAGNTTGAAVTIGTNDAFGLNFETNGSTQLQINSAGRVGIGRAPATDSKLAITGAAISTTNIIASGAVVDLSLSNIHLLKSPNGSAITLQKMEDGGVYTLFITELTSRTYTFSGCTNSYYSPASSPTSLRSSYTISVIVDGANTECFITWTTGFN